MTLTDRVKNLKFIYVVLLAMIISALILVSVDNQIQEKKRKEYQSEQAKKFDRIIFQRSLDERLKEGANKVCARGDENLANYYKTGDIKLLDLETSGFLNIDDQADYIKMLFGIIDGSESDIVGFAKSYINRLIPAAIFLVCSLFSIPSWIICCCCSCCKCCCCCCKKPGCKTPCFIINLLFSAVAIFCCVYGLGKSGSIFTGLTNTECSLLQFVNVISEGESKEELPKWAGFQGIKDLLNGINTEITNISGPDAKAAFLEAKANREAAESKFTSLLGKSSVDALDEAGITSFDSHYYAGPVFRYSFSGLKNVDGSKTAEELCDSYQGIISYCFKYQFEESMTQTNDYLKMAEERYDQVSAEANLDEAIGPILEEIDSLKSGIDDITNIFSDIIIDYSEVIDSKGKLGFRILFYVLTGIEVAMLVLTIFHCLCTRGKLNNCCCCLCAIKCSLCILWNILALLMIVCFLVGFLFTLIGTIGEDLFIGLRCILGQNNIRGENPILVASISTYLDPCLYEDSSGDLANALNLNLNGSMGDVEQLTNFTNSINTLKNNLSSITLFAAEEYVNKILDPLINKDQNLVNTIDYVKDGTTQVFYEDVKDDSSLEESVIKNAVSEQARLMKLYVNDPNPNKGIIASYKNIIKTDEETLDVYNSIISKVTDKLNAVSGKDGGAFDFLNCRFIGTNVSILLKYLGDCLGKNFFNTGVILGVASFGMAFIISSTILINAILKIEKQEEASKAGASDVPEVNSDEKIYKRAD